LARIAIYSHDANPAMDIPILYKTEHYVLDMVARGRMEWLSPKAAQSISLVKEPADKTKQRCQHEDWITVDVSHLPKGKHLNITTKQLDA
jgi:hypothetical protein